MRPSAHHSDKIAAICWEGRTRVAQGGLYDPATGTFFLRNSNTNCPADIVFSFGVGGLVPRAGDWNGDGIDTIAIYDRASGNFFLRNSNTNGSADIVFSFGVGGAVPLAGDWDNLP